MISGASDPYHRLVAKERKKNAVDADILKEQSKVVDTESIDGGDDQKNPPEEKNVVEDPDTGNAGQPLSQGQEAPGVTPAAPADGAAADGAAAAAAAPPTENAPVETQQKDNISTVVEEELEDEEDYEKSVETSIDLTKNTPLLWAVVKGNLQCVWLLLADGYSPNDVDNCSNNALHLAASLGDSRILKVLIDDGASANTVNIYKNYAVDMAKNKECRSLISVAQIAGASMTDADIVIKHKKNVSRFYIEFILSIGRVVVVG